MMTEDALFSGLRGSVPQVTKMSPVRLSRERSTSLRRSFTEGSDMFEIDETADFVGRKPSPSTTPIGHGDSDNTELLVGSRSSDMSCKICVRSFRSYKTLEQHMRLHMVKSYKCNVCGKIFTLKKSYLRHLKSHKNKQDDKVFECGLCNKSFENMYSWKKHREDHDARKHSCNLCGKAFYEKYSLRVHQTSHFYPAVKQDKTSAMSAGLTCHICGKISKTRTAMKNHLLTHSAKKFTCEFCNKRFAQKFSYLRHRRIHTGDKPYKCGSCSRSFTDGSAWSKHIKTYHGIKPYSCDLCSLAFYDRGTCKSHMEKVHNVQGKKLPLSSKPTSGKKPSPTATKTSYSKGKEFPESQEFAVPDSAACLYGSSAGLRLAASDKESEDSQLLDTEYTTNLCTSTQEAAEGYGSIMDSLGLDENFQSDFVERNMPSKPIESDNELITSALVDGNDILDTDIESEQPMVSEPDKPATEDETEDSRRSRRTKLSDKYKVASSPAKCKICHKKFQQDSLLKQHLQFHCMSKLYKCKYCGRQLSAKSSLVRHERIHIGDRPWQCHVCSKTFADNFSCIRHINNTHFNKDIKEETPSPRKTIADVYRSPTLEETKIETLSPREQIKDIGKNPFKEGNIETSLSRKSVADVLRNPPCQNEFKYKQSSPRSANLEQTYLKSGLLEVDNKPGTSAAVYKSDINVKYPNTEIHNLPKSSQASFIPAVQAALESTALVGVKKDPQFPVGVPQHVSSATQLPSVNTTMNVTSTLKDTPIPEVAQRFKCGLCSLLFTSKTECIDHVQNICGPLKHPIIPQQPVVPSTQAANTAPASQPSLYKCSICKAVFTDISSCQAHMANDCQNSDTECAVRSILAESRSAESEGSVFESLPRLPFPEMDTETDLYGDMDSQFLLFSNTTQVTSAISTMTQVSVSTVGSAGVCGSSLPATPMLLLTSLPAVTSSTLPQLQTSTQTIASTSQAGQLPRPFIYSQQLVTGTPVMSPALPTGVQGATTGHYTAIKPAAKPGSSSLTVTSSSLPLGPQSHTGMVPQTQPGVMPQPQPGVTAQPAKPGSRRKKGEDDIADRTCSICSKVFKNKHILKQHVLIHMERKFPCKYCMKKFHNKHGRERHQRIHTGERPYICPTCRRAFSDNSTFRKHTRECVGGNKP